VPPLFLRPTTNAADFSSIVSAIVGTDASCADSAVVYATLQRLIYLIDSSPQINANSKTVL
jgi:hypothetical protein